MSSSERIRVVQYGVGPVGLSTAKAVLARRALELVGAVDSDPAKLDRDVADLSGLKRPSGVRVSNRPREVLSTTRPDVVLHATRSRLEEAFPQLRHCLEAGVSVVSSCEELVYPALRHPGLAEELDGLARSKNAVVLGTGVNPGFVMDTIALVASTPCVEVRSLHVERVVDAATCRVSLQRKVGAGMNPAEFKKGVSRGDLGHKGLFESLHLVARGIGWSLDRMSERVTPVLAKRSVKTRHAAVKAGQVAGIHHVCRGYVERREVLRLDLQMFVGARKPVDRITIKGHPSLDLVFQGGIAGEEATVGVMLSMIHSVLAAPPGLRTMIEVPLPRFRAWEPVKLPSAAPSSADGAALQGRPAGRIVRNRATAKE
jgi:4-hydroxy-tetrahydrodipicolinate reductase